MRRSASMGICWVITGDDARTPLWATAARRVLPPRSVHQLHDSFQKPLCVMLKSNEFISRLDSDYLLYIAYTSIPSFPPQCIFCSRKSLT